VLAMLGPLLLLLLLLAVQLRLLRLILRSVPH
jgi:hypothetical protein